MATDKSKNKPAHVPVKGESPLCRQMDWHWTPAKVREEVAWVNALSSKQIKDLIPIDSKEGGRVRDALTVTRVIQDRKRTVEEVLKVVAWRREGALPDIRVEFK